MSELYDNPQYIQALSNARQCCNATQQRVILFYDEVESHWMFGDMLPVEKES